MAKIVPTWSSLHGFSEQKVVRVTYWVLLVVPVLASLSSSMNKTLVPASLANLYFSSLMIAIGHWIFRARCPEIIRQSLSSDERDEIAKLLGSDCAWSKRVVDHFKDETLRKIAMQKLLSYDPSAQSASDNEEVSLWTWNYLNTQNGRFSRILVSLFFVMGVLLLAASVAPQSLRVLFSQF